MKRGHFLNNFNVNERSETLIKCMLFVDMDVEMMTMMSVLQEHLKSRSSK